MRKPFNTLAVVEPLFFTLEKAIDSSPKDIIDVTYAVKEYCRETSLSFMSANYSDIFGEVNKQLEEYGWKIVHSMNREGDNESWTIKPL